MLSPLYVLCSWESGGVNICQQPHWGNWWLRAKLLVFYAGKSFLLTNEGYIATKRKMQQAVNGLQVLMLIQQDIQNAHGYLVCRIIESLMLEKTSKVTQSNPNSPHHVLSATSPRFLHTSGTVTPTTSLGSLCQCLTTLSEKKLFLISNLNLCWCNLKPLPLVLSLLPERRDQHIFHHNLLSGYCRE